MTILIHITSSPYDGLATKEGLDLAMVLATFEHEVDLAFSGAGIALLFERQQPEHEHGRALYKMLPSFEFYDINNLYVPASEVTSKAISPLATLLTDKDWQDKLTQYTHIFRF